ncbi:hypothetical protein P175DRAFT_0503596 [Aspergillus ochraceoroseus IBT 24754]|uniref:Mso1 N-terminal domain-containing protein n=3 Tax=Aspergillus subgen. Nidulantes TaxID=2720870 RepID=A0A0F8VUK2_9EURO|nr:uncharacterized protein P175DRAFT_0503596 [Aspergillus ochraceoroseus IBT 24754]KKK21587.1 hypothetical protein AOCH_002624 [Aspergillus ochraceoroseus]KKK26926.1 hypothetical protein ARAM_005736 [Aspergillus rambellii]PTU18791.1 hypothetical protein P175DRAFT_0503596 [Aspergillus ochraceoroseus IBT 24754]
MSSYFSSITSSSAISNLGTRLTSLRRAITSGDEADDPDNEDCSHISNVLRAYYTEKGRPYPSWLPPDPKERSQAPSRTIATSNVNPNSSMSSGRGGGLADLWGDSGGAAPPSQTASLRRGRGAVGSSHSLPTQTPSSHSASTSLHPTGSRPLPSQRAASYQTAPGPLTPAPPLERATSAQERLRARLHGGRSPSPNQYPGASDPSARKPVGMNPGPGRIR